MIPSSLCLVITGKDYISIRWTGYLLPAFSEVYTIQVTVNDGARVWVDEVLLIDQYDNDVPDGQSASVFTGAYNHTHFTTYTHTSLTSTHTSHTHNPLSSLTLTLIPPPSSFQPPLLPPWRPTNWSP